jgi:hypothetical protein
VNTNPTTDPTPSSCMAVEGARQHPELTLSHREIIKYVVTEPGTRAQEVQPGSTDLIPVVW